MKKYKMFATILVLTVVLISPFSVSAKTKAGTKPGSFFYFFDKAFEKADLFFTFNLEKKAKKALENAEERLAEAEESASEDNQEAVKDAMENYQKNIEVLEKVLIKVPEEAKNSIEKAIESDKGRQEEMTKKIAEAKQETEEKMNEIKKEEIKFSKDEKSKSNDDIDDDKSDKEENGNENKDEIKKDDQKKEIEKLKKEVEALKQKTSQTKVIEKDENSVAVENEQSSSSQTKQKENILTLPNGAVVEMDENGNILRTIKEATITTDTSVLMNEQNVIRKKQVTDAIKTTKDKMDAYNNQLAQEKAKLESLPKVQCSYKMKEYNFYCNNISNQVFNLEDISFLLIAGYSITSDFVGTGQKFSPAIQITDRLNKIIFSGIIHDREIASIKNFIPVPANEYSLYSNNQFVLHLNFCASGVGCTQENDFQIIFKMASGRFADGTSFSANIVNER